MAQDQAVIKLIKILERGRAGEYIDTTEICRKCPATLPQVCCKHIIPGIPITDDEITAIAKRTNKDPNKFVYDYPNGKFLRKPCIFHKGWKCSIHEVKPYQCRGALCVYGGHYLAKDDDSVPQEIKREKIESIEWEATYEKLPAHLRSNDIAKIIVEDYIQAVAPKRKSFDKFIFLFPLKLRILIRIAIRNIRRRLS